MNTTHGECLCRANGVVDLFVFVEFVIAVVILVRGGLGAGASGAECRTPPPILNRKKLFVFKTISNPDIPVKEGASGRDIDPQEHTFLVLSAIAFSPAVAAARAWNSLLASLTSLSSLASFRWNCSLEAFLIPTALPPSVSDRYFARSAALVLFCFVLVRCPCSRLTLCQGNLFFL